MTHYIVKIYVILRIEKTLIMKQDVELIIPGIKHPKV